MAFALTAAATFGGVLVLTQHEAADIDGRLRTALIMAMVGLLALLAVMAQGGPQLPTGPDAAVGWWGLAALTLLYGTACPGLDRRTRSLINLAMLTALNRPHELRLHVKGALRNGVTKDEIREVFMQTTIYCGVPAAMDSFRVAREVFKDIGVCPAPRPAAA